MSPSSQRRLFLHAAAASLAAPAFASSSRSLSAMTEGPFYPPRAWRERWDDWDADLTRVQRGTQVLSARGELLGLQAVVADTRGRVIDNAEVEIWQCDALQAYRHPGVAQTPGSFDEGFQGFGATRSARDGSLRFRSIKPVPYPGRTPHIHVLLRHASFGQLSSQLFLAGDAANGRDFLWRGVPAAERSALEMTLRPAPADSGLRWSVQHTLTVPA
ncbi:MAG: intradiol ring-cleavage dioxygenase [Chitinophagaceae bacterium]|nr:intradiol ring-cleavage dioxygenase [Rubrivivax sp.]